MQYSSRLSALVPDGDDGWGLYYKACRLRAEGVPITMLSIGDHDIPTPDPILTAMDKAARGGATGYTPVAGLSALRREIAHRVETRTGVPTSPANILVTPGGQAALFAAHMAVLDPGQTGLFIDPFYATYPGTIRAAGGVPLAVPTQAVEGFRPSSATLALVGPTARSLLINSPNNPTGQVYDRVTFARIAAACPEPDLWLISDEVYDSQVWRGCHVSPRELPGMAERTLVVGSMSKSHAMTGSRVGWIVAPEPVIAALSDLAMHTTYGLPGFIQEAALWALQQGQTLEDRVRAPYRRRRAIAAKILENATTIEMLPCDAGMYVLLDISATGLSGTQFAEGLLAAEGIAVMPGESFGSSAAGHLRVAMTVEDDAFADALSRLVAFADTRTRAVAV